MNLKHDWLPTSEIAELIQEKMNADPDLTANVIDLRAGYVAKGGNGSGVTGKVLRQISVSTNLDKAERLLEAVGLSLHDIPSYADIDSYNEQVAAKHRETLANVERALPPREILQENGRKAAKARWEGHTKRVRRKLGLGQQRREHSHPTWTGIKPWTA